MISKNMRYKARRNRRVTEAQEFTLDSPTYGWEEFTLSGQQIQKLKSIRHCEGRCEDGRNNTIDIVPATVMGVKKWMVMFSISTWDHPEFIGFLPSTK